MTNLSPNWQDWPIAAKLQLIEKLESRVLVKRAGRFEKYIDDPVGFAVNELNHTLTPDLEKIMLSVRDNTITLARSCNGPGKTFIASDIAEWFYLTRPDSRVYTTAAPPEENLKRLLWGEIGKTVNASPELFEGHKLLNMHIERGPQSYITGVAIPTSGTPAEREAKFSGKHAPALLFIVDEGDAVPEEIYRGIESCMSGGHVRLLILYNPRAEAGTPYRYERDGKGNVIHLSAFDHPNVITGEDIIPGAVSREITVKRINEYTRELAKGEKPTSECFEVPAFLVGEAVKNNNGAQYPPLEAGHRKVMDPAFSYMVLGEYPAQGSMQLISKEWIARARARWDAYVAQNGERPPVGVKGKGGLDVADTGEDTNAACHRYGGWVAPIEEWAGVDPIMAADIYIDFTEGKNISDTNVDGTGVGASSAPYLQRQGIEAHRVMVASAATYEVDQGQFLQLRDQLGWSCREWLRTDTGAMLPPDEELCEELGVVTYSIIRGKIKLMEKTKPGVNNTSGMTIRKALGRSPNKMDSLWLTFANEDELVYGI